MMSLCYKKPVVVSDLPSFKEVLKDKETAVFFSSENSNSLSEAVNFLLNDEKLLENIKINAFALMQDKFSWTYIGQLTSKAYNKIKEVCG